MDYSPVIPVLSIPCMNSLWANPKKMSTGAEMNAAPAITTALFKVSSPSGSPKERSISACCSGRALAAAMISESLGGRNASAAFDT